MAWYKQASLLQRLTLLAILGLVLTYVSRLAGWA